MTHDRRVSTRLALASLLVAVTVAVAACSKSSSPTSPTGGGSGTPFDLGPFARGQSATVTFATAGTFPYHCVPHASMGMRGTVQVDAGGSDSAVVQVGAGGFAFAPSSAHIKPGGSVRWVNVSTLTNHTVTRD